MNWEQFLKDNPDRIVSEFGPGTNATKTVAENKYNARRIESSGHTFDSKAEAKRYEELRLLEQAGKISNLRLQPRYRLQDAFVDAQGRKHRRVDYVGDFEYVQGGQTICEDVKGFPTAMFKLKFKLAIRKFRNVEFRVVKP